ncbi:TPA: pyruvate dehydrogenase complex dihydrolipoyllysine-residue acetyltransferase [Vibrio parahaemolyticus]|uniref:pyruvate dehydrogenase complex dihydrolipoyllysine-residue acetyltransferase n=1 Tax=Vibrio parahaemolyticus TaxID=670 RepID=UPI00084A9D27|nr:pyruvate dehydrogenase complex dihydrolipoyllysine-residue acetyltransferase [Vibrio parahaemolyticus]EJG0968426.1 pyruvate dehydrogenase complex dihydrolipoyllysine-residue acetyltransferase [Vibrio parahaemolyticus]ODX49679.1 pyruvate dehydrogenase complex dihydrolipoyllysine-residue acetyltransferase [Vibrio parahaemolyticus]ODY93266.1 pyruvate dehydrogenase complex dihydrolipoyllysine-residue acetyltransferase [Vibrio parahaemolyticus]HAS6457567.1 pyruvate dehydrogenase complex dihydroli
MAIEINVPDIGADEVEVTEILVSVGDKVEEEQSLITVEGDKASMEVPASQAGIVKEIKVAEGDKVSTGSLIMIFEAEGAADAAPAPAAEAAPAAAPAPAAAAELKEVHVPDIGGDEVEVTEIMVAIGDSIEEEQSLITVEGDKASMEVPAPFAGTLKEIKVAAGDKVSTGSLIMVFETAGSGAPAAPAAVEAPAAAAPAASAAKEVNVPDIGGDEVEVTEIMVAVGDTVEEEQSLITVEGDKASMEVPAPFAGTVKEIKIAAGDKVSTGSLIMIFSTTEGEVAGAAPAPVAAPAQAAAPAAAAPKAEAPAAAAPAATGDFKENDEYAHASPVVRRLAREFGVNLSKVKGSGRKSRILKEDVQNYVKEALKRLESGAAASGKGDGAALGLLPWPKVDFSKFGETEVQPLSRIKKISGANLHRNWVMIPHVTQWDNADITALEAFRKEQNAIEAKKDTGMKITPLVFIMKAAAKALEAFPAFNSSLSEDGESLILKKYVNIGIAVDTPNGLVVPVFKDVNKKGIYELSEELMAVSKKARSGKLTAADMQGGCFTISSLGGIGGTAFTPIVNAPEVGILGVSKSEMKPVWNGKEFEPRLQLPLSLSYDHRVIDGAEGARFITYLNSCLSDIRRLVL